MSREKWEKLENLRDEKMAARKKSSLGRELPHFHFTSTKRPAPRISSSLAIEEF
jgi:hypothetical protein